MELRTEDILESITDVFFALDLRWRFTYLNERAVARARVARGEGLRREELIGRSCWEAFPELAGTVFEREFRRALTEHKTVEFEAYSPPTDSRVEVRVYPTSEGLAVYSRDITERTRAEEVLRNSEERFRATFEQAAVGIAHLAPDGKWLRVNQKLCDIVGYTREELLRKTFQEITHPDDLDADLEQYRRLLAGEIDTYSMEKRYVRKDDSIIWIELTVSLVREQPSREPSYFIAVIVDVSERKRAEEEVREAGRRTENILENITDAFSAVDREWRFTYVNEHTVRIVSKLKGREFSREELVGQNIWEMFPNVLETSAEVEYRLAMAEQRSSVFEYHYQDEGMEEEARPWFEINIYPSEEGLSFYYRDVTERKGAEEELRRSEVFARSTLNSLSAHIAILDEKGWILATNLAWQRFAASNPPTTKRAGPGTNYLEVCDRATGEGSEEAFAFARGIRDVISGRLETFELEYPCHSPDEKRWFVGRVTRFPDTVPPKVVVAHENVTDLALAEGELEARARQQAAVAELGLKALEDAALGGLMDDAVALVARNLRLDYAKISELLPGGERLLMRAGVGWEEGLVGTATEEAGHGSEAGYTLGSEGPIVAEDLSTEGRFRSSALVLDEGMISCVSVIIHGSENPFGVLSAHSTVRRSFSEDDVNFLQEVANVLTIAIERRQAQQRVEEVREVERSRMARDLHDGALQDLSGAMAQLLLARTKPEDGLEPLSEALKQAERSVRAAIYGLALEGERERTFSDLLENLLELHRSMAPGLEIGLDVRDGVVLEEPPGKVGRELLRIVGEALTNARRHSGASSIRVGVAADEGRLIAEVEDDGLGFDPAAVGHASADGGVGLNAMRERARSIGGTLAVESGPGRGTKVRFEMVLEDQEGSEEEEVVRILLVEDHAAIREALASAFEAEGFEVVGQAGSLAQARRMIREAEEPLDVAVVDLGLPDGYGADLIGELREAHPHAQALVLSASLERADTARAVGRGAAGVLSKTAHLGEVLGAVRRLRAGETLMPLEEVVELLRFWSLRREEEREERMAIQSLTPREVEVLRALAEGLDSAGIAAELNIALRTERNHMSSILGKLGVHSQLQALVFALRHGVVEIR